MKKILLVLVLVGFLALPVIGLAQVETITAKIGKLTDMLKAILYAIAVLFIVLAAFNFITAAGDPEKIKSARNYVVYALVGVIVAVLAGVLVEVIETTVRPE